MTKAAKLVGIAALLQLLGRIVVVGFVLVFIVSAVGSCLIKSRTAPDLKQAPWVIQTESRVLFAKSYSSSNKTATDVWYQDSKGKFHFVSGTYTLSGRIISVQRRRE